MGVRGVTCGGLVSTQNLSASVWVCVGGPSFKKLLAVACMRPIFLVYVPWFKYVSFSLCPKKRPLDARRHHNNRHKIIKRDGNQEPKDIVHYLTIFLICLPKQVATTTATFRFDPTRTILSRFSFSISWFQFQQ
jgi:hypothetical protein